MIDLQKYKRIIRVLFVVVILIFPFYLLVNVRSDYSEFSGETESSFVGKEACKECHEAAYKEWEGSHHDLAMDVANDSTVLGDFSGVEVLGQGKVHHLFKKDGRFFANTDGENGKMADFEIKYVFGYTPLQQYLVEFDKGRLQVLALTWSVTDSSWYHMADSIYQEDEYIDHHNWLHWTNQAQNWNSMCADCHSTNVQKGYDPVNESYHTTWSEIDVSCEACHGPGSQHIAWAKTPEYLQDSFTNSGLQVRTSGTDNKTFVENCARCHSRRTSICDFKYKSADVYNHIIPSLPEEPNWHVDGQIKEEDYVYASFIQSKMYMNKVQCNDCHNVHSGKLRKEGNQLCLQCHQGDIYDSPSHHFHKSAGEKGQSVVSQSGVEFKVGEGTKCVNCHMHGQYYMGVDYRHDHSFRIPRPDLSIQFGVPNACNQCHADKSMQWAQSYIEIWYGQSRNFHFSEAFAKAEKGSEETFIQLKNIFGNYLYPASIRAIAVRLLAIHYADKSKELLKKALGKNESSIRLSALSNYPITSQSDLESILPLLLDEVVAVRVEVVRLLVVFGYKDVPINYASAYTKAFNEYEGLLRYNSDFPAGKYNYGNFYYGLGKLDSAKIEFEKTLELDNRFVQAYLNLAYVYNHLGDNGKAEAAFENYLKEYDSDVQALYAYGLLLSEMQKYDQSLNVLLKVVQLDSKFPRANHNIAMIYDFQGDKEKAEKHLKLEVLLQDSFQVKAELLRFYLSNNQDSKANALIVELRKEYPDNNELMQLERSLLP